MVGFNNTLASAFPYYYHSYPYFQTKCDTHLPDHCHYKGYTPSDSCPSPRFFSLLWHLLCVVFLSLTKSQMVKKLCQRPSQNYGGPLLLLSVQ